MIGPNHRYVRKQGWKRPSAEERADHVRTLERLGQLVVDRSAPIPIWFVLMSGFPCESVAEPCDRTS